MKTNFHITNITWKLMVLILILLFFVFINITFSQKSKPTVFRINTRVLPNAGGIEFFWQTDPTASSYKVYKRPKNNPYWSMVWLNLPGSSAGFSDTTIREGNAMEYKVLKMGGNSSISFVYAGIRVPAIHFKGSLILLVDNFFSTVLSSELSLLISDLEGDGWNVLRHDIARNETAINIRSLIKADYTGDTTVKAVYIIGQVPVPYSGNICPDGHSELIGAWQADVYYGEMNGYWSDMHVNSTVAPRIENQNIPGDGKFDQCWIPTDVELQVGRVNFQNLQWLSFTDTIQLQAYLYKNHQFRHGSLKADKQGFIDDTFFPRTMSSESLASTSFWAGQFQWDLHHLDLGENIGYSVLVSQNREYWLKNNVNMAWMGDPSLKMFTVLPPANLTSFSSGKLTVHLEWKPSADSVTGYYIYRKNKLSENYALLTKHPVEVNQFTDSFPAGGVNYYMVRAEKLEFSASGSFYNLSQGIFDTLIINKPMTLEDISANVESTVSVFPNPGNGKFLLSLKSLNYDIYSAYIIDVTGKIIVSENVVHVTKETVSEFDISQFTNGIYYISVNIGGKTEFIKYIKH